MHRLSQPDASPIGPPAQDFIAADEIMSELRRMHTRHGRAGSHRDGTGGGKATDTPRPDAVRCAAPSRLVRFNPTIGGWGTWMRTLRVTANGMEKPCTSVEVFS